MTFFAPPKKVTKERGSPVRRRHLVNSCDPLRCSPRRGACATRAPSTRSQMHQAGRSHWQSCGIKARPVLSDDPVSHLENVQEGRCLSLWTSQWTGSYAAVPANGPAANESQPPPFLAATARRRTGAPKKTLVCRRLVLEYCLWSSRQLLLPRSISVRARPRLCENSSPERFGGSSDHYPMSKNATQRILASRFFGHRRRSEFSHSLDPERKFGTAAS